MCITYIKYLSRRRFFFLTTEEFGCRIWVIGKSWQKLAKNCKFRMDIGMFIGRFERNVNKDGRVSIPSKMRQVIEVEYDLEKLYLFLIPGNTIGLFPEEEFKKLAAEWFDNPEGATLREKMALQRLGGSAEDCKVDGSGRIVIPPLMRQEARIGHEALMVGATTHIEIWDPERFDWQDAQDQLAFERITQRPVLPDVG